MIRAEHGAAGRKADRVAIRGGFSLANPRSVPCLSFVPHGRRHEPMRLRGDRTVHDGSPT